MGHIQTVKVP